MAFIDKQDPVVLNIKLTSKGRELLSEGKLAFKYFAIGDSEIDYNFVNEVNLIDPNINLPFNSLILRPVDKNPNLLSFITRNNDTEYYNLIPSVPSTPTIIQNTVPSVGFFYISGNSTTFNTDINHVKQPDGMVIIDEIIGGDELVIYKSPTYLLNENVASVGDLLLVKWTNPSGSSTTGYSINVGEATPYLVYRIIEATNGVDENIISSVRLDRELPNFGGNDSGIVAGAMILYNFIDFTGNTIYNDYPTDYISETVLAFLSNSQCDMPTYPFWNMSIIFTEEIAGVQNGDAKYTKFNTNKYGGFVSYIQNQAPVIKKMGVIHYTNFSPTNTYGEELYKNTPILNLPMVMWHKSQTNELGLRLRAYGAEKKLTGDVRSLNTTYYDLVDNWNNVVGKVFNDLKLFVIEDQELLFAISYKSNRSWTLPQHSYGINNSTSDCPICMVMFDVITIKPDVVGTNTGRLWIHNIINTVGISPDVDLVLSVSGVTHGQVYFSKIVGNTLVSNLYADTYRVIIYDLKTTTSDCVGVDVTIEAPNSKLKIYDIVTTENRLNSDFEIEVPNLTLPKNVRIYQNSIGGYGEAEVGFKPYGTLSEPTNFVPFTGAPLSVDLSLPVFKGAYTIVVRNTETSVTPPLAPENLFKVVKNYVAVGSPLNPDFTITTSYDDLGRFITISNYLTTINNLINPIMGTIEYSAYVQGSFPSEWIEILPSNLTGTGVPTKIYVSSGTIHVIIREMYTDANPDRQRISIAEVGKYITVELALIDTGSNEIILD